MLKRLTIALATVLAIAGTMLVGSQNATAAEPVPVLAAPAYGDPFIVAAFALSDTADQVKRVAIHHPPASSAYRVKLQKKSGKSWKTVTSKKPEKSGETRLSYKLSKEGSVRLRAVITKGKRTVDATKSMKATWKREATKVHSGRPFDVAEGRIAAYNQVAHPIEVPTYKGARTGSLQEYRNGKWVTVQKLTWKKNTKTGYSTATAKSPKTTSTVTRKYRVVINRNSYARGWTSKTSTIRHENPRHYSGQRKASYDHMKAYCPNQIITLIDGGTSYAHFPSMRIEMSRGLSGEAHKSVALHECAHILTYELYGYEMNKAEERLNKIFKSNIGVEMVADCMSYRMGADPSIPSFYTDHCKGDRDDAAKKILAGQRP